VAVRWLSLCKRNLCLIPKLLCCLHTCLEALHSIQSLGRSEALQLRRAQRIHQGQTVGLKVVASWLCRDAWCKELHKLSQC
jgi:hypothetical protein